MSETKIRHGFREAVWSPCIIRTDGTQIVRGLIMNVSKSGAEIRCKHRFELHQHIEVVRPVGHAQQRAEIVRDDGNIFGVKWVPAEVAGRQ